MGAFQLRFLDRIPAHAAIDESVELTKQSGHRFASGLVNAVLRKVAAGSDVADSSLKALDPQSREEVRSKKSLVSGHDFSRAESTAEFERALAPEETAAELALTYAHPAWLVERWTRFYGLEAARDLCRHGQVQPARTIRLVNPAVEAELIGAGVSLQPATILVAARSVVSGDITATAAYREGRARLQDEGSQLIAELAAYATEDSSRKIEAILDACAAPGGKTLILAERNPQARILACESSQRRLSELRERLSVLRRSSRMPPRRRNHAQRRFGFRSCPCRCSMQRHWNPQPQSRNPSPPAPGGFAASRRTPAGDSSSCSARGPRRRSRCLFNLLPCARRKRAGRCRRPRRQSERAASFSRAAHRRVGTIRNPHRPRRRTTSRLPHTRRRAPPIARRSAYRRVLCRADRKNCLAGCGKNCLGGARSVRARL